MAVSPVAFLYAHVAQPVIYASTPLCSQKPLQWFHSAPMPLEVIHANEMEIYLDFYHSVKRRLEAEVSKDCIGTYSLSEGGN